MPDDLPRPTAITIGALLRGGQGINLTCSCGHKTALLPSQIAAAAHPETRVLDFKRRFRCSMCGCSGATPAIRLTTFVIPPSLSDEADPVQPASGRPH